MSDDKMSPEMQIAIRRSPDYTAPSAELVALRAEVAAWRRAVRWVESARFGWALVIGERVVGGVFGDDIVGWRAEISGERQPDRNTACAKVCELLGIPVVLPVGGE